MRRSPYGDHSVSTLRQRSWSSVRLIRVSCPRGPLGRRQGRHPVRRVGPGVCGRLSSRQGTLRSSALTALADSEVVRFRQRVHPKRLNLCLGSWFFTWPPGLVKLVVLRSSSGCSSSTSSVSVPGWFEELTIPSRHHHATRVPGDCHWGPSCVVAPELWRLPALVTRSRWGCWSIGAALARLVWGNDSPPSA